MADNYSVYPQDIDGYAQLPLVRNQITEIRAEHHNALRDAIVKIEQELGIQPSGSFGTVKDRLDDVGDASSLIDAHLIDTADAHDASAISIIDPSDHFVSADVEGALGELASVLPNALNVIGQNNTSIPNSGYPDFVGGTGALFLYNGSGGSNILTKTQPVAITGIRVIEIGDNNTGFLSAQLAYTSGTTSLQWKAPGDSLGAAVDISGLSAGDVTTLSSSDTTKKIRIARTSASLPVSDQTENFIVTKMRAYTGAFSITGTGIVDTNYVVTTAADSASPGSSFAQFAISGIVYPADKGTLVLQRKARSDSSFVPIAVLDLSANFSESDRATGQGVYSPSFTDYDVITLFDRLPARKDYEELDTDANGDVVYSNYNLTSTYNPFQVAKYVIPVSNVNVVSGTLTAPSDISAAEMNAYVTAYRIVHYKPGVTDFTGEPDSGDIYSVADSIGTANDGDNTVRMSNVIFDNSSAEPSLYSTAPTAFYPASDLEVSEKIISGIHYYNSNDDLFNIEVWGVNSVNKTYLRDGFMTIESDSVIDKDIAITDATDIVTEFSDSNLPLFADDSAYYANAIVNPTERLYPETDAFSTNSYITIGHYSPLGNGQSVDRYGLDNFDTPYQILINSYDRYRASESVEYFTDESLRVGTSETFNFNTDRFQFTNTYQSNPDGYRLELWDNTVPLSYGDLQVGGRFTTDIGTAGLVFPQNDYTGSIKPTQDGSANYSDLGYRVDSTYQRLFNLGHTIVGGRINIQSGGTYPVTFNDMRYGNSNRMFKVELKIPGTGPGSTGWLDLGRLFSYGYEDGDGCLDGYVSEGTGYITIPFTFGTRNNADAHDMVALRITYFGAQFLSASQMIITKVELLDSV